MFFVEAVEVIGGVVDQDVGNSNLGIEDNGDGGDVDVGGEGADNTSKNSCKKVDYYAKDNNKKSATKSAKVDPGKATTRFG